MMTEKRMEFCVECRKESPFELKRVKCTRCIREKEYTFEITKAFCKSCGEEILLPGMMDERAKDIDAQYRKIENLVTVEEIEKLMDIYNIGKAPLSLALGFGEITITRYLQGQMPSKEYSDIMKEVLQYPECMLKKLNENESKIGETAYKKAVKAASELKSLFSVSEKMLSVISYIFEKADEVTPLALQKLLYYIQGIFMSVFGDELFDEDCTAWVHGPVYESVYELFKTFKYNPIDDHRFVLLKDRFKKLNEEEKEIVDLVVNTFGLYSGKALERITHQEEPWKQAREGYLPMELSSVRIEKNMIKGYFDKLSEDYNLRCENDLERYICDKLKLSKVC